MLASSNQVVKFPLDSKAVMAVELVIVSKRGGLTSILTGFSFFVISYMCWETKLPMCWLIKMTTLSLHISVMKSVSINFNRLQRLALASSTATIAYTSYVSPEDINYCSVSFLVGSLRRLDELLW